MSCRVLKRTVEQFMMNFIIKELIERGIERISGEYLPTAKNKLVEHLLDELSLIKHPSGVYDLEIKNYTTLKTYITNG